MPLFMDLIPGDGLEMDNGRIKVTVEDKSGRRVRLRVDATKDIPVRKRQASNDPETRRSRDHPAVCRPIN
jgi:pyruvate kinase